MLQYDFNTGFDEGPKMKKYTIVQFVVSEIKEKGKIWKRIDIIFSQISFNQSNVFNVHCSVKMGEL